MLIRMSELARRGEVDVLAKGVMDGWMRQDGWIMIWTIGEKVAVIC